MDLISFFIANLLISGVVSTTFTVTNKCNYTIWPGFLSNEDDSSLSTTSLPLQTGQSKTISAPASWGARFWGHTYCTEDSIGKYSCITGDCGSGKPECSGNGTVPPAVLTEFKLDGSGRVVDLNRAYPLELKVNSSNGEIMVCKCVCQAFGSPQYCASTDYQIIFCAAKNTAPRRRLEAPALDKTVQIVDNTNCSDPNINQQTYMRGCKPTLNSNVTVISSNVTVITRSPTPAPVAETPKPTSPEEKTPNPLPEIKSNTTSRRRLALIIAGVIGGALLIISLVVIINFRARWWMKWNIKSKEDVDDDQINLVPGMPVRFSYEDLCIATDNFKETLGRGGFGSVFKGVLADGTGIAVKRLDRLGQGKTAFLAEVETIGSLHHFNLVRLIGFCAEKSYALLVYEYMSNGSLDNWIFKKNQRSSLDWQTRKKIILDIAKGLAYLHEDCRQTIMHLDIKPQNILLDPNFNAKISDFGLSKLVDRDMSQIQISMRGTPGYLAPEWCQSLGRITVKVDIYSFGIVLLEVVCARKNVDDSQPESAFHLLRMLQNKAEYVVDHLDYYMQSDREETIRMMKIAAWCLQDDPERRPPMSTVVKVLEGVMEIDSNLVYKFSHALTSSAVVNQHISSAPMPASVLSYPR